MKTAQLTATIIYLTFFILMIPLFTHFHNSADVAATIEVLASVSPWLPFVVAGGAIASQFSASVADSLGASGLIDKTSRGRVSPRHAYALIGIVSVLVLWETNVVALVSLASRAFGLFYALQCIVAAEIAWKRKDPVRFGAFTGLALTCALVTFLGIPAE